MSTHNVPSSVRSRSSHHFRRRATHDYDAYTEGLGGGEAAAIQAAQDAVVGPGQIMPGTIASASFAQSIRPVILVTGTLPTLPDPGYPVDTFVYKTDDSPPRLYKNQADVWVAAIGPDDIQANSITAGQIAAGAVSTDELAVGHPGGSLANSDGGVLIDDDGITIVDGKLAFSDQYGDTVLDGAGFGGAWRRFLLNGLYNGDLHAPVPTIGSPAGAGNDLPYWPLVKASGTAIDLTVVADATQPLGYRWHFAMAAGAAGDETYIEQVVPVLASRNRSYAHAIWILTSSTNPGVGGPHGMMFVRGQYLTAAGATVGSEADFVGGSSTSSFADVGGTIAAQVPATAAYLRIRIGMKRDAAAAGHTCAYELYDVRLYAVADRLAVTDQSSTVGSASTYLPAVIASVDGVLSVDTEKSIYLRKPVRLIDPQIGEASADLVLGTSFADIAGATVSITNDVVETLEISFVVDFDVSVTGVGTCIAQVLVDGVAQGQQALFATGAGTGRATVYQGPLYVDILSGPPLTKVVKLQARKTSGGGTATAHLLHTRLVVRRWARMAGGSGAGRNVAER